MTSCEHYCRIYINDLNAECIHRLDAQGADTHLTVNDNPWGLSVNVQHIFLFILEKWFCISVTCVKWINVFSEMFSLRAGVTQGWILSLHLFAIS